MTDPDRFLVRHTEIDPRHPSAIPSFQFAQPLMRHSEIGRHWNRKDAAGKRAIRPADANKTDAADPGEPGFGREMNKHRHDG